MTVSLETGRRLQAAGWAHATGLHWTPCCDEYGGGFVSYEEFPEDVSADRWELYERKRDFNTQVPAPTTDELLAALPADVSLIKTSFGRYFAQSTGNMSLLAETGIYDCPAEALADLWLKLREDKK